MNSINSLVIEGTVCSIDFSMKDTVVLKMDNVRHTTDSEGNRKEEHINYYTEVYGAMAEHIATLPLLNRTLRIVGRLAQYSFNKGLYVVAEHVELK